MTIKQAIDSLPINDQRLLNYAFEHEIAQFVKLPDGRYIGVNMRGIPGFKPELEAGVWTVGKMQELK